MKGASLIVAAIVLAIIVVILVSAASIPVIKPGDIERDIEVRSEIHIMGNALEAAKLYSQTALEYSAYQGCYDNLKNGGLEKLTPEIKYAGFAIWSEGKYPDEDQFIGNLQDSINASLELYRKSSYKFMDDYYVDMPSHTIAVRDYDSGPGMTVSASSGRSFFIDRTQESGEYIRLEKDSSLQGDYVTDCYGTYLKGAEIFNQAKGKIGTVVQDEGTQAANEQDFEGKKNAFKVDVGNAVAGFNKQDGGYQITADVLDASIYKTSVTPSGISYYATAYVKFTITNPSQQFPVYDGQSVAYTPLSLVFVGKFGS